MVFISNKTIIFVKQIRIGLNKMSITTNDPPILLKT